MRLYFLLFLMVISLFGRDNPFFSADPSKKQVTTSNRVKELKPFSTQQLSVPNSARAIKAVTITYQNLDGSIEDEQLELNNAIDWHQAFIISQKKEPVQKSKPVKRVKTAPTGTKFINFVPSEKSLKIVTTDKLLRHFMLTAPYRIVVDFERDTSFKPKNFVLNNVPFNSVRMGNHDKYYRVVIELDGQYEYALQSSETDHTIVCQ